MTIDGDRAVRALTEVWNHFTAAMPEAWMVREDGALAGVTGVPLPTLNRVWVDEIGAEANAVATLLDQVAATGLPHCLQLRPGCDRALGELAARRGMTPSADIPLMVLEDADGIGVAEPTDLLIRPLAPEDASHHASVAAAGFEAPEEYLQQLITTGVHTAPGVCCYLGELHGEPVTTGLGVTLGDYVGIFNIVTRPAHRRQGYGATITARAVRDGLSQGALWAWLQSSPAGYPVYQRMGFRTVESWPCWLAPGV
jgi:GNAT superfamily N-acetyltransferase